MRPQKVGRRVSETATEGGMCQASGSRQTALGNGKSEPFPLTLAAPIRYNQGLPAGLPWH